MKKRNNMMKRKKRRRSQYKKKNLKKRNNQMKRILKMRTMVFSSPAFGWARGLFYNSNVSGEVPSSRGRAHARRWRSRGSASSTAP